MADGFAAKWFALYYPILGLLMLVAGSGLIAKREACAQYLVDRAQHEQSPALIRQMLKYFFLFTLPCLVLAFIPFSWTELLFSIWSLVIVYAVGIQLARWPTTRHAIREHPGRARRIVRMAGAGMLAVSPVMFLLGYLVIQRLV